MEVILKRNDYVNYKGYYNKQGISYLMHKPKIEFDLVIAKRLLEGKCPLYKLNGSLTYIERIGDITTIDEETATVDIFDETLAKDLQRHNNPIKFIFSYEPAMTSIAKLGFVLAYVE